MGLWLLERDTLVHLAGAEHCLLQRTPTDWPYCAAENQGKKTVSQKKGESVYIERDIFLFTNTKFWRDPWSRN